MDRPTLTGAREVAPETVALESWLPVPGFGVLAVNAFLIRAAEPVLVDTGLAALRGPWLEALGAEIEPADLRWIWLTHTDPDHVGNLAALLERAPRARVVTNYLGAGKLGLLGLPTERARLLNPGQHLDVGDRRLAALRPPTWDAPETMGLVDTRTGALFSADAFGALLQRPVESAAAVAPAELSQGLVSWASVDAPWLHGADASWLDSRLDAVRGIGATAILSGHLPPARGMDRELLELLATARTATPFVGPDQAALERTVAAAS